MQNVPHKIVFEQIFIINQNWLGANFPRTAN